MEIVLAIVVLATTIATAYIGYKQGVKNTVEKYESEILASKTETQKKDGVKAQTDYYFELYPSKEKGKKTWRFRLKAGNHEIVLASEAYTTKANARKSIKAIRENAFSATVNEVK